MRTRIAIAIVIARGVRDHGGARTRLSRPCQPARRQHRGERRRTRSALTFTQNLEAAFSSVEVTDAKGARVDQGKPQISGNTMRVGLKASGPGRYQVHWHVLSVDTHKTEGNFSFTVGGP